VTSGELVHRELHHTSRKSQLEALALRGKRGYVNKQGVISTTEYP